MQMLISEGRWQRRNATGNIDPYHAPPRTRPEIPGNEQITQQAHPERVASAFNVHANAAPQWAVATAKASELGQRPEPSINAPANACCLNLALRYEIQNSH
jgi:hypothetical protein